MHLGRKQRKIVTGNRLLALKFECACDNRSPLYQALQRGASLGDLRPPAALAPVPLAIFQT
jgi:hypothetical protein